MQKQTIIGSILIVIVFIISFYGINLIDFFFAINWPSAFPRSVCSYFWWILPTTLVTGSFYGFKNILNNTGLNKGMLTGLIFSIISVLPMIISSAIIGNIDSTLNFGNLIRKTLFAGFFEEYLFRGFLFGILFRKLKWGFIPASILGAIIFGVGHIYQGNAPIETIGIFSITAMGAVWFAWLYIEWENNLWIPIFLHITMNLSWILFEVSNNALGGIYTNIFRSVTIALTITITVYYHKKRELKINRRNLIINNNN